MEAFLVSLGVVALGEMGDKTQLLSLVLATRFRQPAPIILGIATATLANHILAGVVGASIAAALGPRLLRWLVGVAFIAMAAWALVPDREDDQLPAASSRLGVYGTTLVAFFLAEMGDKTQIATVALAARFHDLNAVIAGTTLGMLVADVPVVLLGGAIARAVNLRYARAAAALVFAALGALTLGGGGHLLG